MLDPRTASLARAAGRRARGVDALGRPTSQPPARPLYGTVTDLSTPGKALVDFGDGSPVRCDLPANLTATVGDRCQVLVAGLADRTVIALF